MNLTQNQVKWLKTLLEQPDYDSMAKTQDINELEAFGLITVSPGGIAWGHVCEFRFNITEEGKVALRGYLKREVDELEQEKQAALAYMRANLNGPSNEVAVLRIAEKISRELHVYVRAVATKPEILQEYKLAGGDPRDLG